MTNERRDIQRASVDPTSDMLAESPLFYLRRTLFGSNTTIPLPPPPPKFQPGHGGPINELNAHDVLCGRGGRINSHEGNIRFREIVSKWRPHYVDKTSNKIVKAHIAAQIVTQIRNLTPPGRFLRKDQKTGVWLDIGDERARKKAGQALREISRSNADDKKSGTKEQHSPEAKMSSPESEPRDSNLLVKSNFPSDLINTPILGESEIVPIATSRSMGNVGLFREQNLAVRKDDSSQSQGSSPRGMKRSGSRREQLASKWREFDKRDSCRSVEDYFESDIADTDTDRPVDVKVSSPVSSMTDNSQSSSRANSDESDLNKFIGFQMCEEDLQSIDDLSVSSWIENEEEEKNAKGHCPMYFLSSEQLFMSMTSSDMSVARSDWSFSSDLSADLLIGALDRSLDNGYTTKKNKSAARISKVLQADSREYANEIQAALDAITATTTTSSAAMCGDFDHRTRRGSFQSNFGIGPSSQGKRRKVMTNATQGPRDNRLRFQ